ncbi:MAG: methionyl-tRNA formyltransferase [Verrucomicrobia bacterium]|nr:MAG: methionyl-tRNA formyltransferase [Verrucomicrobiota bacterium]
MRVAFMASDAIALDSIRALFGGGCPGFELACVVSNPDRPKGRGKKLSPNDVSAWALENGVELLRPEGSPDESDAARMRELGVEMIVVMAYGRMLKKNVLEYGRYPCLNLHASLLPQLRGASPVETAIALGFKSTGVSLMAIEPRMDSGPVCAAAEVAIAPSDGSASLRGKIAAAAARLLSENISSVADGSAKFEPQDESRATYTRKIAKEDLFLDFRLPAEEIANRARAFSFAVAEIGGEAVKLSNAFAAARMKGGAECGEVVAASRADGLRIACGAGDIVFGAIQRPCSKMLSAPEFFAGNSIEVGKVLKSFDSRPLLRP